MVGVDVFPVSRATSAFSLSLSPGGGALSHLRRSFACLCLGGAGDERQPCMRFATLAGVPCSPFVVQGRIVEPGVAPPSQKQLGLGDQGGDHAEREEELLQADLCQRGDE
jgi:hypothetical protein